METLPPPPAYDDATPLDSAAARPVLPPPGSLNNGDNDDGKPAPAYATAVGYGAVEVRQPSAALLMVAAPAQPLASAVVVALPDRYTTGLWSCTEDTETCLVGCVCPSLVVAQTYGRDAPGDGGVSARMLLALCPYFLFCAVYVTRKRVQAHYGIRQEPCARCMATCCCPHLAACQDAREVRTRRLAAAAASSSSARPSRASAGTASSTATGSSAALR